MADLPEMLPKPKYSPAMVLQKNSNESKSHVFPSKSTSCVVGRSTAAETHTSSADDSVLESSAIDLALGAFLSKKDSKEANERDSVFSGEKCCIEGTLMSEDGDRSVSYLVSDDDTLVVDSSPSLRIEADFSDLTKLSNSNVSIDAMSTVSNASKFTIVPLERCFFLDEDMELMSPFSSLFLPGNIDEEDEEVIIVSPEYMWKVKKGPNLITHSTTGSASPVAESPELVKETVDSMPQTPKALPVSRKLDSTDLEGVARLLETAKALRSSDAPICKTRQVDCTDIRSVKKLFQTPKPLPATSEADYRQVKGVKRLLATPYYTTAPITPIADYTDVEGVRLLMKTPEVEVGTPRTEGDESKTKVSELADKLIEAKQCQLDGPIEKAETTEAIVCVEESIEGVSGVIRLLKTQNVASRTSKADHSDVQGTDVLVKTPKPKQAVCQISEDEIYVAVTEVDSDQTVAESSLDAGLESCETTSTETVTPVGQSADESTHVPPPVDQVKPPTKEDEHQMNKGLTPHRRRRRAYFATKTVRLKRAVRSNRKPITSEWDSRVESNATSSASSISEEEDEPVFEDEVESPVQPAKFVTPKRSRRLAAARWKNDATPKPVRSTRGKRVYYGSIDLDLGSDPAEQPAKIGKRMGSVSSGEEWGAQNRIKIIRRRVQKVALHTASRQEIAVAPSDDELDEEAEFTSRKKTTNRRAAVERGWNQRLRGETETSQHVFGSDGIQTSKTAKESSSTTSTKSTRNKSKLKVHFNLAELASSPVRSNHSAGKRTVSPVGKKLVVLLERDHEIDCLAARMAEIIDKATTLQRSRQKNMALNL